MHIINESYERKQRATTILYDGYMFGMVYVYIVVSQAISVGGHVYFMLLLYGFGLNLHNDLTAAAVRAI